MIADLQQVEVMKDTSPRDPDLTTVKQADSETDTVAVYVQKLIDGVDDSIPESVCLTLNAILKEYADVFSQDENDLGRTHIIMHHIDTDDSLSLIHI